MPNISIRNGTAVDAATKCASCTHGHIIRGFRESEEMVFCTMGCERVRIPFKVRECTGFEDKTKPDWEQMEKLAINIQPDISYSKPAGFRLTGDEGGQDTTDDCELVSSE
jgi:hypothetical protein